jgi:hypothetical protein
MASGWAPLPKSAYRPFVGLSPRWSGAAGFIPFLKRTPRARQSVAAAAVRLSALFTFWHNCRTVSLAQRVVVALGVHGSLRCFPGKNLYGATKPPGKNNRWAKLRVRARREKNALFQWEEENPPGNCCSSRKQPESELLVTAEREASWVRPTGRRSFTPKALGYANSLRPAAKWSSTRLMAAQP